MLLEGQVQALVKQLDAREHEAASASRRSQELQDTCEQQRKEMQQLCTQLAQLREDNTSLKVGRVHSRGRRL
jgi:hypothetical protein